MRAFEYASATTIDEALAIAVGERPEQDGASGQQAAASSVAGRRTNGHGTSNGHGMNSGHSSTIADTLASIAGHDAPRFLAGGTDMLTLMKADVVTPALLIDVKRIDDLPRGIQERPDGITIGALTTLSEVERHPAIVERYTALSQAIGQAATPQLRNMATIGGNLLQRPRCWYFRSHLFHCWLKGGESCPAQDGENQHHALFGGRTAENPCVAVHPSDPASALVALGAEIRLRGSNGERTVPIAELFAAPTADRRTETTVRPDELLVEIRLPSLPVGARSTYLKAMDRKVWAFALVGVAAALRLDGGRIAEPRLVLSGVAQIPWRARQAEQVLAGQPASPELFARAADAALADARPLEENGYKVPLARGLIQRALTELTA